MNAGACERVGTLLAEWISGELDAADSSEVRAHLATCAACRAEETGMREMLVLLESDAAVASGVPDPGDAYWRGFGERVRARIPPRKAAPKVSRVAWLFDRLPQLATGLAAAAVLAIALNVPFKQEARAPEDPAVADLLVESVAPPSLDGLAGLGEAELDRLGNELASVSTPRIGAAPPSVSATPDTSSEPARVPGHALDELDDLSPGELDKLLERLDAFET